jgi:hypothetical protein
MDGWKDERKMNGKLMDGWKDYRLSEGDTIVSKHVAV